MNQVDVLLKNGKIVTQGKVIEGFVAVDGEKIVTVGQGDHAPDARVRRSDPRIGTAPCSTRHASKTEPVSQGQRDAGRSLRGHRMFRPSIVPGDGRQAVSRSSSGKAPGVGR